MPGVILWVSYRPNGRFLWVTTILASKHPDFFCVYPRLSRRRHTWSFFSELLRFTRRYSLVLFHYFSRFSCRHIESCEFLRLSRRHKGCFYGSSITSRTYTSRAFMQIPSCRRTPYLFIIHSETESFFVNYLAGHDNTSIVFGIRSSPWYDTPRVFLF